MPTELTEEWASGREWEGRRKRRASFKKGSVPVKPNSVSSKAPTNKMHTTGRVPQEETIAFLSQVVDAASVNWNPVK